MADTTTTQSPPGPPSSTAPVPASGSASASPLNFRPPSTSSSPTPATFQAPTSTWISGTWHVTHSTLPMWKTNRNVSITYTLIPDQPNTFDNLVEYNPLNGTKQKTVAGIEKPDPSVPGAWNWRGKGWLMIASSHWEALGSGEDDGGWFVVFFQKTLFTPAGIDILTRRKEGVSGEMLARIRGEIGGFKDDESFAKLAGEMFEVKRD